MKFTVQGFASRRRSSNKLLTENGFSLLEVVIALTILAMISTTLFAIIKGSVKGASDIERTQRENDQINRILDICRVTFQTMPASATLTLKQLDSSGLSSEQELAIAGVPTCFGFGMSPTSYEETVIGLRPDVRQPTADDGTARFMLCITRKDILGTSADKNQTTVFSTGLDEHPEYAPDDQQRTWMPLLAGVTMMKWRFFKDSTDEWLEEWSSSKWPDLIELQLQMEGRALPMRMVWAVPETQLRSPTRKSTPATSTTTTTTTTSGGGNAPR
jgi:prepilin-type N-terminal cleavage/methylation domain-containing protein